MLWVRGIGGTYIWAVLSQGGQDLSDALVLTLVLRDHLNGVGIIRVILLEGSESLVTLLDLWVQRIGDRQGGKSDDGDTTHIELDRSALH